MSHIGNGHGEGRDLEERIATLDRECGCQASAAVGLASLSIYLLSLAFLGTWPGGWVVVAGLGFLVFAVMAASAKALALSRIRRRRERLIAQLQSRRIPDPGRTPARSRTAV